MDKKIKRPKEIWYCLYAFLGTIPVAVIEFVLTAFRKDVDLRLWDINAYLLDLAITVLLMLLIFRKKNWARIVYTVLTGLVLYGVFLARKDIVIWGIISSILLSLQVCLRLLSVYLLFVRQSRDWFKTSNRYLSASQTEIHKSTLDSNSLSHNDTQGVVNASLPEQNSSILEIMRDRNLWRILKKKRSALIIGGLAFVLCILIVSIYIGNRTKKVAAIRNALTADTKLAQQLFGNRSMANSDERTLRAYTQGLRKIDMSSCPRNFQLAYLDHIQAWESLTRSRASVDVLGPLIELFVLKTIPNIPDNSGEQQIHDEIAKTWGEVERIALSYGVKAPVN